MTDGYGYRERPQVGGGMNQGSPAAPRRRWPRGVGGDVRDPGVGGYPKNLITLVGPAASALFGNPELVVNSTFGSGSRTHTQNGWDATWNRHGYMLDLTTTSTGQWQGQRHVLEYNHAPKGWLDVVRGVAGVLRVEDVVMARTTSHATGDSRGQALFGLTDANSSPPKQVPDDFMGFQSLWMKPDTDDLWDAIVRVGGATVFQVTTAARCGDVHRLAMEMDGGAHQFRFYVDGVEVASYDVVSGSALPLWTTAAAWGWHWEFHAYNPGGGSSTVRAMRFCDPGAIVTFQPVDLGG